jgi:hypothetical protein
MAQKKSKNQGRNTNNEGNKPKVVKTVKTVSTSNNRENAGKRKVRPTESRSTKRSSSTAANPADMIFGKQNYILMGVGLALMIIGFMLMSGGEQAADAWKPGEIYSFRRTVLAPFVILAGLVVEIFAIFKK